tara:strand:- start:47 stop:1282 length:1236 start_codon:yes stop_codon:yes gene_type:complete
MSVLKVGAIQPNSGTKVNITGSTLLVTTASGHFSGSYEGDGSRLSGVAGFPFTGSGTVSGSLLVTGSSTLALRVTGSSALTGSLFQSGSSQITGSSTVSGSLLVTGSSALALRVTGSTALTGSLFVSGTQELTDNSKLKFGNAGDLEIYHDGSNSYIKDGGTGDLKIQAADDLVIENTSGANSAVFNTDGGVELYWRGGSGAGKKFEVTQTGLDITGDATLTGTLTAATGTFVYQIFESSSTIITSGSNIFGDKQADIQQITGSLKVTGSVSSSAGFSGSFQGDGSDLTGVGGFPHTGSADITGSLLVTGSAFVTSLTETSALRYKKWVKDLPEQSDAIFKLRPVHFRWKDNNQKDVGLIAEEVQKVYPELVSVEDDGQAGGIKYTKLTAILVKTIQDLTARIEKLENNKK